MALRRRTLTSMDSNAPIGPVVRPGLFGAPADLLADARLTVFARIDHAAGASALASNAHTVRAILFATAATATL